MENIVLHVGGYLFTGVTGDFDSRVDLLVAACVEGASEVRGYMTFQSARPADSFLQSLVMCPAPS